MSLSNLLIDKIWKPWSQFWFESDGRKQLALFRPAFALLMLFFSISRAADLRLFYTSSGIMPLPALQLIPGTEFRVSILKFTDSMVLIWGMQVALLVSLSLLAFNIWPRFSTIVAYVAQLSFMNRNMAVSYGADTISTVFLFYLCFADFRPSDSSRKSDLRATLGSMAYRLSQIQLCIIYAYAGLDKARGYSWWNGEALWYVMANNQLRHMNFDWMAHFPVVVVFLTYSTLFWEIYFPVMVWVRRIRYPVLVFGVFLHIGISMFMGLKSFGILMILLYLLFLQDSDAVKIAQCLRKYAVPRKVFGQISDQSNV